MSRDIVLHGAPAPPLEYASLSHPNVAVEEVAKLFDAACRAGQIESNKTYGFDTRTKTFFARPDKSGGNPAIKTAPRPRPRLTVAQAREKLRLVDFVIETARREELVDLRRRARGRR